MLWNDTRSATEAAAMDSDPQFRAITGNIVFPGFTAPKVEWVRNNEPDIFASTRRILLPKDYLRLWLTGEAVSEMSDASGTSWLDTGARDWSDDLLAACHLDRSHMPQLVEGSEVSGHLRADLASRWGMKVGARRRWRRGQCSLRHRPWHGADGAAFVSLGTSGVLFAANDGYKPNPTKRRPRLLPCLAGHVAPDGRHPIGHRRAELVGGRERHRCRLVDRRSVSRHP